MTLSSTGDPGAAARRVAIVGTGARAQMFTRALAERDHTEVVALSDVSPTRMAVHNRILTREHGRPAAAQWDPGDIDRMLRAERVDTLVVCTVDALHARHILAGLDAGCRVITEKPMVTTAEQARQVLDAADRTGGDLAVTFNYRFNPLHGAVRELLAAGEIGDVLSVHFEWMLDVRHGADYFRRWHRDRRNSGGLMVHKSGHHFDLVNWWLGAEPVTVYGVGRLAFYGARNGTRTGLRRDYERAHGSPAAADDPFALRLDANPELRDLYLQAEGDDGYVRDRNVFDGDISIEDDMAVLITYDTGASMTYHLTAYAPWEGYRIAFNGTRGRIELEVEENIWAGPATAASSATGSVTSGAVLHGDAEAENAGSYRLRVRPMWAPPRDVEVEFSHGGHGGGDVRMLAALFDPGAPGAETLATPRDGVHALLTGLAAGQSFSTGLPVQVKSLL
ncbi:Gfo/Idh/MocA family oxidoreductase [Actinomadura rudentiformis]|uniref:Gfo/Idh/MocA family oxidoreductase n=1 Tax=Actinomadura rudentiformis TaxID=359158 RepID=A0A6H9Z6U8_9ACTN|nr:Gfo/Idh/MocA family oxidoreductase [Actinomadura rudentiformis]KAB2349555.1 Gfo/Idh/MocA family oxidoreductase [Actinomadura rudentiformis]